MVSSNVVIAAVLGLSVGFGTSHVFADETKTDTQTAATTFYLTPTILKEYPAGSKVLRSADVVATIEAEERSTETPKFDRDAILKQAQNDRDGRSPLMGGGVQDSFAPYLKENPAIDYEGFAKQVKEVYAYRAKHRVSEEDFIAISKDPATVIFDGRSEKMFNLLHVKGAINLSIPDVTAAQLAKVIPTKETRVLIYCNNNFTDEPDAFAGKAFRASLNVYTFNTLYSYGYKNIYELGPLLNRKTTKIEFEGSLAQSSASK